MLKNFLDRLLELARPETVEIEGLKYSTGKLSLIGEPRPVGLSLGSLTSLDDYLRSGLDLQSARTTTSDLSWLALHVRGPARVDLLSKLSGPERGRDVYASADCEVEARFKFGVFLPQEHFVIGMQTMFAQTDELRQLLSIVGMVTCDEIETRSDDGVTQTATMKVGVTLQSRADIPSPVTLRPYRTFREIKQPESPFVLRVRKGLTGVELALFEADGGAWKTRAMEDIKVWLETALPYGPLVIA